MYWHKTGKGREQEREREGLEDLHSLNIWHSKRWMLRIVGRGSRIPINLFIVYSS